MVSKQFMNVIIAALLISVIGLAYYFVTLNHEPPVDPETKYTCEYDADLYLVLNSSSQTAFLHGFTHNDRGDYVDRDGEITVFIEGKQSVVFEKYENGSLGMKLDGDEPVVFELEDK